MTTNQTEITGPLSHFQLENRYISRRVYTQLIKNLGLDPDRIRRIVLDVDEVTIENAGGPTVKIEVGEHDYPLES